MQYTGKAKNHITILPTKSRVKTITPSQKVLHNQKETEGASERSYKDYKATLSASSTSRANKDVDLETTVDSFTQNSWERVMHAVIITTLANVPDPHVNIATMKIAALKYIFWSNTPANNKLERDLSSTPAQFQIHTKQVTDFQIKQI